MKQKYAFTLSVLITALLVVNLYFFKGVEYSGRETAIVTRIIDGDTIVADNNIEIRLANINTPEKGYKGYEQAKEYLLPLVNKTIEIEIIGEEKYGRKLARLYAPEYLNLEIVKNGLATKFLVEDLEKSAFAKAELQAMEKGVGIWEKSHFFGCFESKIDYEEEYANLKSRCGSLSLKGWTLSDESRKRYKFQISNFNEVTLHTKEGVDNSTDIFWNVETNIWNNDADTLYVFDSEEKFVHYESYGY